MALVFSPFTYLSFIFYSSFPSFCFLISSTSLFRFRHHWAHRLFHVLPRHKDYYPSTLIVYDIAKHAVYSMSSHDIKIIVIFSLSFSSWLSLRLRFLFATKLLISLPSSIFSSTSPSLSRPHLQFQTMGKSYFHHPQHQDQVILS